MKGKEKAFYLFTMLWAAMNIFCIWAPHIQTVKNLNASTATAYFNLEANAVSSADKIWTLSFNRTAIENNTNVTIQVVDQSFDQLLEAPKTGYVAALEKGCGKSWYEYDMFSHSIIPLPQKTIVLKLSSGKYAKVEIQNYYKDGKGDSGYYTFRYEFIK